MNQYQACLHSFECISHGDSNYVHEIPKFWHFWKCFELLDLSYINQLYNLVAIIGHHDKVTEEKSLCFKDLHFT